MLNPCHGMGRVSGQYWPHLRGPERPWEAAHTTKLPFAWKWASAPCSRTSRESDWVTTISASTWSSLLQLLTSSTIPLNYPLPAPQKVKNMTMTQSYAQRLPPLRGFSDFPNKRNLTAELSWYYICTVFFITNFFSFVKWSILMVEKLRNMEKSKGKKSLNPTTPKDKHC